MILSNTAIQEALDAGRLVISPPPLPRRPSPKGPCPYQTSSVDLRLGDEISFFNDESTHDINLRPGEFAQFFQSHSTTVTITEDRPFILEPHKLVLGRTLEQVELPIRDDGVCLAARVEGRSSFARCGLLVHFTAPTVHAGYSGAITLELINLGPYNIALYPNTPICQLIVESVQGTPFRNDSQFQGQTRPGGWK